MPPALDQNFDTIMASGWTETSAPLSPRSANIRAKAAQERQNGVRWAEESGMHPGHVVEFDHLMSIVEQKYVDSSQITGSKKIAQGSFGEISSAMLNGKKIAVKQIMLRDADNRAQHMRDVLLEVNVNFKIEHPNVVNFYGVAADFPANGKSKGVFLGLVFEFCDGGSLFQRLHQNRSRNRMTISEKVSTLFQISCGVEHMHSLHIVHRDLSDMNILLCSDGGVKIADLGCARQLTAATYRPSTISGSPPFMAPEQLQGQPITLKVDVWALGVLTWELFTERKPWENAKPTATNKLGGLEYMQRQMIHQKKNLPPVSWPVMTGLNILKAIYSACMDRDEKTRFSMSDARESLQDLNEQVKGSVPPAKLAGAKAKLEADLSEFYGKVNSAKVATCAKAVSDNGGSRAVLNAKLRIRYGLDLDTFKPLHEEHGTVLAQSVVEQQRANISAVGGGIAGDDHAALEKKEAELWNAKEQELLRKEQEIARFAEINIAQQRALADAKSAAVGSGGEAVSINAFGSEFEMRDAAKEQRELSQIGLSRRLEEERVRMESQSRSGGSPNKAPTTKAASTMSAPPRSVPSVTPRAKPAPKRLVPIIPFKPLPPDFPPYIDTYSSPEADSQPARSEDDLDRPHGQQRETPQLGIPRPPNLLAAAAAGKSASTGDSSVSTPVGSVNSSGSPVTVDMYKHQQQHQQQPLSSRGAASTPSPPPQASAVGSPPKGDAAVISNNLPPGGGSPPNALLTAPPSATSHTAPSVHTALVNGDPSVSKSVTIPDAPRRFSTSPLPHVSSNGDQTSRFAKFGSPRPALKNSPRSAISASPTCPLCPHRTPFGATDGVHDVILPEGAIYRGSIHQGRYVGPAEIVLDDGFKFTVSSDVAGASQVSSSNHLQQQVITLLQESRRERMRASSLEQELEKLRIAHSELSSKYVEALQRKAM